MKIAGSGSGSISQRHGSADPDPDPDPSKCHGPGTLEPIIDVSPKTNGSAGSVVDFYLKSMEVGR